MSHYYDDEDEDQTDYNFESLCEAFDEALAREEVAPGFHRYGPYVFEVFDNGDVDLANYLVLPSCVGWEPRF